MRGMIVGCLTLVAITGCATVELDAASAAEARQRLMCQGKEQCEFYWRRAQVWLAKNSVYRIQSATDTVISTHGPTRNSVDRAYQVVRAPITGNIEEITIASGCANIFGCATDALERELSFKRFVRTGN